MAKFNFNLRDPKTKEETAIHLIVRWNNLKLKFPTKERINPKFWETDKSKRSFQRARETKQFSEYPEFNARLDKILQEAKNLFRQYVNDHENQEPSLEEFREILNKHFNNLNTGQKDLFGFIEKFIKEAETRINDKTGKPFSKGTLKAYRNTYGHLLEYKKLRRKSVDFDTIDLDFYHDFTEYLTKTKGFATNTIGKQIKTVKTFLSEATERGVNKNIAFKSKRFKVVSENTDSIYLTNAELDEIYSLDLSNNERLEKTRDLFLVGCYTGLRFSDFTNIQPKHIKNEFIEIQSQKTAEPVVIPIHPIVKAIMKNYKGKYPNSLPPAISNVKMNLYLKEIGQMVKSLKTKITMGVTKGGMNVLTTYRKHELLTTHTARRSFASNLYIEGVPSYTIMKITGHKTERAFLRYIKITPNENAKILQLHWKKINKINTTQDKILG